MTTSGCGKSNGGLCQKTSTHRTVLVRQGKASKVMFLYTVEEACRIAGITGLSKT